MLDLLYTAEPEGGKSLGRKERSIARVRRGCLHARGHRRVRSKEDVDSRP